MALQLYTLIGVYVNGALLAEEGTVSIDVDSRAQEVNTVAKGFAGLSPGAAKIMVRVDNAIPAAAFEVNPGKYLQSLQVVEFTFFAAGATLTTKGFITKYSISHGVNSDAKLSFEAECEPQSFA